MLVISPFEDKEISVSDFKSSLELAGELLPMVKMSARLSFEGEQHAENMMRSTTSYMPSKRADLIAIA